jgi:hypothetical protein
MISFVFPPMGQGLKDWLQAAAWVATAVGLVVTAIKFWSELRAGRLQRDRDLRWRQAEAGKSLNDEMQMDDRAWPAMQMLDSESRAFTLPNDTLVTITRADIVTALDPASKANDEKSVYIRDCFDALFYFMAMLEHYISNTLIRAEDVAYPIEYYVPFMVPFRVQITAYLNKYGLSRTRVFLERYAAWRVSTEAHENNGPKPAAA